MIDILNTNPGVEEMHCICGSTVQGPFEIHVASLNSEDLAVVTNFFESMPKNVGVVINNIDSDIEIKYFSSNITFIEEIEEVDYLTTEHKDVIDSFVTTIIALAAINE